MQRVGNGEEDWIFTYDANGMRKTKNTGSWTYTYTYNGSQLTQMTFLTSQVFYFTYDPQGHPATVKWNNHVYYYITNLQGDVIAIADQGVVVVEYKYDAWGKLLSITGSEAQMMGRLNPLRYRGYVYDQETGLYYLQSRYYNPEWGRFLNADAYASTGQGILGNNMFAYCGNNPVNRVDPSGNCWRLILESLKLLDAIKMIAETVSNLIKERNEGEDNNSYIPAGGETVYEGQVRICTDGSDGTRVLDDHWYAETALFHNGKPLDAYTIYYVVMPLNEDPNLLGSSALLINHDTGMYVWCVVGEKGPAQNGWGEVSIAAIWDTGNPDHSTANSSYGLGSNYEIILYRNRKYDFGD